MKKKEEHELRDEVRREFQVERVILFSDAVFAIVITLMAIEIRLPEDGPGLHGDLGMVFKRLAPVIIAYMVSFFFIGTIWYRHLRIFSIVRDYDLGLIVRNLVLLFLVGLFPFSATLVTHSGHGSMTGATMYLVIIIACMIAQFVLQHYILVQRPALRYEVDIAAHLFELRRRRAFVIGSVIGATLMVITSMWLTDPDQKPMAMWWMAMVPLCVRIFGPKKNLKGR